MTGSLATGREGNGCAGVLRRIEQLQFHKKHDVGVICVAIAFAGLTGCEESRTQVSDIQVRHYERTEPAPSTAAPELTRIDDPRVRIEQAVASTQPSNEERIARHLPDPAQAEEVFRAKLNLAKGYSESLHREANSVFFGQTDSTPRQPGALKYIKEIERAKKYRLSLDEAIRLALANNYQIHFEGYGPAISTAQIVQAEAAFDAAFFMNLNRTSVDQPRVVPTQFQENQTTLWQTGISKLFATGATATLTYQLQRTYTRLVAAARPSAINPAYTENFIAELRQPFLRNFGIDFNRSQINIRKNEERIAEERFRRNVIEVLNNTERAYWALVAARRDVVVSAELLAQAELTLAQVTARIDYDAYQTLKSNAEATAAARRAEFIRVRNTVGNSEDALLNFMNDPQHTLAAGWEIIPTDNPTATPVVRDWFHEVETALEHRPEILEAKFTVENARQQLGIVKNQALPRLDAIFRWTANGLGRNADKAFDQMSGGDWADLFVGMEFQWNFGERAERAGIRAAAMAHSQSIFAFKRALDDVITDCRTTLRELQTNYEQIGPSAEAVSSSAENLISIQQREERKSPEQLNTVLSAQTQLAQNRRTLLQALTNYNTSIVNVERAKGTLLEFNNVVLSEIP